jgi:hypothetical protein
VKRAAWFGAFGVFLVLLWYSTLLFEQMVVSSRLEEKKTEWSRLEPANQELREASNGIRLAMDKINSLDRLATNRFLWAPVLNALQYTMVEDRVQLVRLNGDQSYVVVKPPEEKATKDTAAPRKKGKPATSTEKILLTLDARDFGTQGEQNFNAFIDAISRSPYFKDNLVSGGVRLAKLLPPSQGDASKAFTLFTVECKFPEKERN